MDHHKKYVYKVFHRHREINVSPFIFEAKEKVVTSENGTGVLVGKYFITAAHVINDPYVAHNTIQTYVLINKKKYVLEESNRIAFLDVGNSVNEQDFYENPANGDLAIYHLKDVPFESALHLSSKIPAPNEILDNFYYRNGKSFFTKGKVIQYCGNFIGCEMSPKHPETGGSSGSPLYRGNTIYGILQGGKGNYCAFISSTFILKTISENTADL